MKKLVSIFISIILLVSSIVTPSAYSWDDTDILTVDEAIAEYESRTGEEVETNRYYFLMPNGKNGDIGDNYNNVSGESMPNGHYGEYTPSWYTCFRDGSPATSTAGIYWWGSGVADPPAWMGYLPSGVDENDPDVYYADVPQSVTTIIWNNGIDGGIDQNDPIYYCAAQSCNIPCEYYDPGESVNYPDGTYSYDNMIFVIDPDLISVAEISKKQTCGGEWYYYYGSGCYGITENGTMTNCVRCDHYDAEGNHIYLDIEPTEPTEAPTQAPTEPPTQAPTEPPTQAPTELPTGVVKSIEMRPITLRQYIDGVWKNSGTDTEYFHYTLPGYEHPTYTITFSDGSTRSFNSKEFVYKGKEYEIEAHTDQSYENQWKLGNEYTMTFTADGVSVEVPITLYGIEKIVCEPITLIQETHGVWRPGDVDEVYFHYTPEKYMEYKVTFSDGRVGYFNTDWFEDGEGEYQFEIETNQSYKNSWKPGNTYTMIATLMGITVEVPVTIKASPIKSVVYEPVTLIKEHDGVWDYVYNSEIGNEDLQYFHYQPEKHMRYTVTFTDGTVKQYSGTRVEHNGETYEIECITNQSFEQQWVPGNTYAVKVKLLNTTVRVPVTITKSKIKDVTFEPVTLIEGIHSSKEYAYNEETGEYDLEYNHYSIDTELYYTVTLYDGSKINCHYYFIDGDDYLQPKIETYQSYYNQWEPGNTYTITVTLMDTDFVVPVTIEKNPIKAISFEPMTWYEGIHNYYFDDELGSPFIPTDDIRYTITWDDGTTTKCYSDWLYYNNNFVTLEFSTDQSEENQWEPGNTYTMTATLMGVSTQVPVTIKSNPIKSVEMIKAPDDCIIEQSKKIEPKGAVLRVYYTDGKYDDVTIGDSDYFNGFYVYLARLDCNVHGFLSHVFDEQIETKYLISLLGYEFWIDVTATSNEMQVIIIKNNGTELELTAVYNGGEQKKFKVLGMKIQGGSSGEDYISTGGSLITDKGCFGGIVEKNTNTGALRIGLSVGGEYIYSNTLDSCLWWDLQEKTNTLAYVLSTASVKEFNGEITSDNIDYLVNLAIESTDLESDETARTDSTHFRADSVKIAFYDTFGVVPDLSLSKRYNAKEKTYTPKNIQIVMPEFNMPFDVNCTEDGIVVTIQYNNGRTQQIIFNEDLQIKGLLFNEGNEQHLGDADGDGNITIMDATMIQRHIAQLATITDNRIVVADTDKDGQVTIMDATVIQRFIAQLIPEL